MFKKIKYSPTNNRGIIKTSRFLTMCGMKKIFAVILPITYFLFFSSPVVVAVMDTEVVPIKKIESNLDISKIQKAWSQQYLAVSVNATGDCVGVQSAFTNIGLSIKELTQIYYSAQIPVEGQPGEYMKGCVIDKHSVQTAPKLESNFKYGKIYGYEMQVPIPCQPIAGGTCPSNYGSNPAAYIARLYQFGLMIAGLAAFGMLVYASLLYTLSAGSFTSQDDAKKMMWNVLSGVLLLMGAYLILYTINPNLVSLRDPQMPTLDLSSLTSGDEGDQATKATAEDHPLCQSGTYTGITAKIGISLNTSEGTKSKTLGADFICNECKSGASKTSIGDCACNPGYILSEKGNKCFATPTN